MLSPLLLYLYAVRPSFEFTRFIKPTSLLNESNRLSRVFALALGEPTGKLPEAKRMRARVMSQSPARKNLPHANKWPSLVHLGTIAWHIVIACASEHWWPQSRFSLPVLSTLRWGSVLTLWRQVIVDCNLLIRRKMIPDRRDIHMYGNVIAWKHRIVCNMKTVFDIRKYTKRNYNFIQSELAKASINLIWFLLSLILKVGEK